MEGPLTFLYNGIRRWKEVGAFVETMPWTSRYITSFIRKKTKRVLEFGAGTGPVTKAILDALDDEGSLDVYETNPQFVDYLLKTINDTRLRVHCASAEQAFEDFQSGEIDHVISGIPFSYLPEDAGDTIVKGTADLLGKNGIFTLYQFRRNVEKLLEDHFDFVSSKWYWKNLVPPYFVTNAHNADYILKGHWDDRGDYGAMEENAESIAAFNKALTGNNDDQFPAAKRAA